MRQARIWKKLDNNTVQCLACAHECVIAINARGKCGVRVNHQGELFSLVYGKCVALYSDPIEKKPLYHFYPNSLSLSIGTYGCNFHCSFCQNHELSQFAKTDLNDLRAFDLSPDEIVIKAREEKFRSISYTYSEPTVWCEYTLDTIEIAKSEGIAAVYVSNGYQSKMLVRELVRSIDAINIDLKFISDALYIQYCGARLNPILDNIREFHDSGVHVEVTTLLIPELNDTDDEIREIARFLKKIDEKLPWHISRFLPMYRMQDRAPTPITKMRLAYEIAKEEGLKYVYLGNVGDAITSSTYCPNCGKLAIERRGYDISIWYDENLRCRACGQVQDVIP